jgi:hypothetical protein
MLATKPVIGGIDYDVCRYGASRVTCRGPRRQLNEKYVSCLGGSETFGQFIEKPYSDILESQINMACVNFGVPNGGLDVFLNEPEIMNAASKAAVSVVVLPGAQNVSNRMYKVHPRRNDRFLRPSPQLAQMFPQIDFTEFHFTRHLLLALQEAAPDVFPDVIDEVRYAWAARVRSVISQLRGRVVLLWLPRPESEVDEITGRDPLFITQGMVDELRSRVIDVVSVHPSQESLTKGTREMIFSDFEEGAARELPNPTFHADIANALEPAIVKALSN